MKLGLIGKKLGMTRVFTETAAVPVTVIDVSGNRLAQIKTAQHDGYDAVQVAFGEKAAKNLSAAKKGHLAKHKVGAAAILREFRAAHHDSAGGNGAGDAGDANGAAAEGLESGAELGAAVFAVGEKVDVTGVSKGKGFAGVMKRHHFKGNRQSHGNSRAHRKGGSTGQCQDPGRTFPGKKMPGRLGGKRRTAQSLEIARIDGERNLLLVRGCVAGAPGGYVLVRPAVKTRLLVTAAATVAPPQAAAAAK